MWTQVSQEVDLVTATVANPTARKLLFQARANLELFQHASTQLHEALNQLNSHNMARAFGSSHMDDGIFGADKHASEMLSSTQRVFAFLLAVVTSGHRFTITLKRVIVHDVVGDLEALSAEIDCLYATYHNVRNFLEHLDEEIAKDAKTNLKMLDCTFTREAILTCSKQNAIYTFDFTEPSLGKLKPTYDKLLGILKARERSP